MTKTFVISNFGYCDLFGICNLIFVILTNYLTTNTFELN